METKPDSDAPVDAAQSADEKTADTASAAAERGLPAVLFLVLAIAAGAAFFGIARPVFPIFAAPPELLVPMPPPEIAIAREAALSKARMFNAAVAMGRFGLLLGGLAAGGEAAARRFAGGVWGKLLLAAIFATTLGFLGGLLGQLVLEQLRYVHAIVPIGKSTLGQVCGLGTLGLGVGIAAGLGAGNRRQFAKYAGGGAVSGILAGLLFPTISAFAMHRLGIEGLLIPGGLLGSKVTAAGLALWIGCFTVAVGVLVPLVANQKSRTE